MILDWGFWSLENRKKLNRVLSLSEMFIVECITLMLMTKHGIKHLKKKLQVLMAKVVQIIIWMKVLWKIIVHVGSTF